MVVCNRSSKVGLYLLCIWTAVALDIYPWGKYDFKEHSEQLLDGMRNYEHLKVWESTITPNFLESDTMLLKNNEGNTFQLNVKDSSNQEKQESGFDRTNFSQLMTALQDNCAMLIDGYWSYEWCHGKEVKQFHLQEQKQQKGKFKRSPEWSLGKHKRLVTIREKTQTDSNAEAKDRPISKLIEYFEDGQPCDETGSGRATTVHTMCCEGTAHKNFIASDVYFAVNEAPPGSSNVNGAKLPAATVSSIEEPSLCRYEMVVCTPLLCPRPAASQLRAGTGGVTVPLKDADTPQLAPVMKFINGTCLTKQEDWWTYELCFNAGLRQVRYDIEQSVTPEGRILQKNTLVSQYLLGAAPLKLYMNETALKQHVMGSDGSVLSATELAIIRSAGMVTPTFRTRGRAPRYLTLGFEEGTPCDLDAVNRSTVVDLYCGPKNRLVSVWEDSTCHYHAKVELAILCSFEHFVPYKENTTVVEFTPYDSADADLHVELDSAAEGAAAHTVEDLPVELDAAHTEEDLPMELDAAHTVEDLPVELDSAAEGAAAHTEEDLSVQAEVDPQEQHHSPVPDNSGTESEEAEVVGDGNRSEIPLLHSTDAEGVQAEDAALSLLSDEKEGEDAPQESREVEQRQSAFLHNEEADKTGENQQPHPVLAEEDLEEEWYDLALDLADLRLQFPVFDVGQLVEAFDQAQWQRRQQRGSKPLNRRDAERMIEQLTGAGNLQEEAVAEEDRAREGQSEQAGGHSAEVEVNNKGEQH